MTASIFDRPDGTRVLYLNGIPEVDTSLLSVMTFRLIGSLPNLLHPDPENALMITFGAGITSGTAARFVDAIDSVDIATQAGQIGTYFQKVNESICDNSKLSLIADDARHYLLHTEKKYDVIVSDATHPRVYDSWVLFTREFYKLVAAKLKPDGIFCQWVPFHGLHPDRYTAIIRTFNDVSPHTTLWRVGNAYSLMIATPTPLMIDFKAMVKRLNTPQLRQHLGAVDLGSPFDLLQYFSFGNETLARLNDGNVQLLSDNSPQHLFFPCDSTFREQYTVWPERNADIIRTYEESVIPYLDNLGENDAVRRKIFTTMKHIESLKR